MIYIINFTLVLLILLYSFYLDRKMCKLKGSGRIPDMYRLHVNITLLHIIATVLALITAFIYMNQPWSI